MKWEEIMIAGIIGLVFTATLCTILAFENLILSVGIFLFIFIIALAFQKEVIRIIKYKTKKRR